MKNLKLCLKRHALLTAGLLGVLATTSTAQQLQEAPFVCGTPELSPLDLQLQFGAPTDCELTSNSAGSQYDPGYVMQIQVVWQVIHQSSGFGDVSDTRIMNQMQYLNDCYRAQLGPNGNDTQIEFVLASEDPMGNPTNGIVRTINSTWFFDNPGYADVLSWDSNRYLNIYTLIPGGNPNIIGYVPGFPASGVLVGTKEDGVRMLHSAIDSVSFPHVTAHEIGHHLGLFHTFQGLCENVDCSTQGDLICDTEPHDIIDYVCGTTATSCGGFTINPNNFMTYQDAPCVWEFTTGQVQRMRCTVEIWRPQLYTPLTNNFTNYCTSAANSTGSAAMMGASGTASVGLNNLVLHAEPVPNSIGLFFYGPQQDLAPFGNGFRCVQGGLSRMGALMAVDNKLSHPVNASMPSPSGPVFTAGSVWDFQAWFRDIPGGGSQFNLSDGLEITFQP